MYRNVFEFNKDADRYVCQAGHMSFKKSKSRLEKHAKDGVGNRETYFFDVEKCKNCPHKEGCYKDGGKTKTYSVTIKNHLHDEQAAFQESEYFKEKSQERYKSMMLHQPQVYLVCNYKQQPQYLLLI